MKTSLRSWHTWVSVLLAVPIVLVAATAILIAHDDGLGTKHMALGISDPQGATSEMGAAHDYELKSYAALSNGYQLYGTRFGLVVKAPAAPSIAVDVIGATEVRDIAEIDGAVFVAAKTGLWRLAAGGQWSLAARGDFWTVMASEGAIQAVSKGEGLVESRDGGLTFAPVPIAGETLAMFAQQNGAPPYTLQKLVMDIHTGKLFFGKHYEWIWIDLVGGVLVFLTISGLIMWRRSERRKTELERAPIARGLKGAIS